MSRAPFLLPPMLEQERPPEQEAWLDGYLQHFSASGLRLLRVCPEAWRQRYILGRKERPGESLTLGSAVHDATAFNMEQKIDTHEDKPVQEVVEYSRSRSASRISCWRASSLSSNQRTSCLCNSSRSFGYASSAGSPLPVVSGSSPGSTVRYAVSLISRFAQWAALAMA